MVKTKRKGILRTLLCAVFALCFAVGLSSLFANGSGTTASAATTPKYTLKVTGTKTDGTWGGEVTKNVTDATSVEVKKSLSDTENVSFYLNGTSVSGSGTLSSNSYITFSDVHISSSVSDCTITLYDNSVRQVVSGTSSVSTNLSDGRYKIRFTISRSGGGGYTKWSSNIDVYTYFYVDATAPKVSGASKSTNYYKKNTFTVSASDGGSGGATLYVKKPASSSYIAYGSSKTVNKTDTNGLYSFYAKDNVGNRSATYYVYLDSELPVGTLKNASGTALTKEYTNGAFFYSATDGGSGINYLQYKKPNSTTWTSYTSGTNISASSVNGTYQFRAVDKAGNISATKSITLDSSKPTGELYDGNGNLASGGKTKAKYIKYVCSDGESKIESVYVKQPQKTYYESYVSGSELSEDGTYYFYCKDVAGNSSVTLNATLVTTPPTLSCLETSFYSVSKTGFTVSAADSIGSAKLYYKTPSNAEFLPANAASFVADYHSENGKYYFYAVDELNNRSETVWIELAIVYPDPRLVYRDEDNAVSVTWTDGISATLNGEPYEKGTWITAEGGYEVIVTNAYGLQTKTSFSITHRFKIIERKAATCTERGYCIFQCVSCGGKYEGNREDPIGHDYKTETIAATCIENGYVKHTCKNCGDTYETDQIAATGHLYTEYTRAPACETDGGLVRKCTLCGYEYIVTAEKATGHEYATEIVGAATCETDGERRFYCKKCGNEYFKTIPAFGHTFELLGNEKRGDKEIRMYRCATCGAEKEEEIENLYGGVSSYMIYLFELYSPYMKTVLLITSGIWSVFMGVFFAIAQRNDEKEKSRRIIRNYLIGIAAIFVILAGLPYLLRGIAALISG